jgi:type IV secretion system protein VirB11
MGTIAAQKGTVINYDRPFLEAELPIDGSRFEGIIPPVTSRPVFAIRQRPRRIFTLDDYERGGILSRQHDPVNRLRRRGIFLDLVAGLSHAEIIQLELGEKEHPGGFRSGKTIGQRFFYAQAIAPLDQYRRHDGAAMPVQNYVDLRRRRSPCGLPRRVVRLKPTRIVVGEVPGPRQRHVEGGMGTAPRRSTQ